MNFIVSVVIAITLVFGCFTFDASAADVQKAYVTSTVNASEFDMINKYNVEARAKVGLYKGLGIDTAAFYDVGSRSDDIVARVGVFYQPVKWAEVSYSTEFGVDNINNFGNGRLVKFSIGKGF